MIDVQLLKDFVPLDGLHEESLRELAESLRPQRLVPGEKAFSAGDRDGDLIYLLEGRIALVSPGKAAERLIQAGSEEARYALAKLNPRPYSGIARSQSTVLRVDSAHLDRLLTRDQALAYEVVEYEGSDPEWMVRLLSDPNFAKLPPASFHGLFSRLETLPVRVGQTILRQGEEGDYYYLIKSGRVRVEHEADSGERAILAELGPGESFGEEALLAEVPRNATITVLEDGVLMRLDSGDFTRLLRAPLVHSVTAQQLDRMLADGARLIDVRLEGEYAAGSLPDSINIPLYLLRLEAKRLDPSLPYVLCCQNGNRSTVAAFLLSLRGFEAYVLEGGLDALPHTGKTAHG